MLNIKEVIFAWLDKRFNLKLIKELSEKKLVPSHKYSIFYYLGGMTLILFIIQVCTGVLLLLYYRPSPESAFESVQFIMTKVNYGWLIRSVHAWGANLMIATMFLHMFTVYFMRAYRPPRELTWITGVLLFFIVLTFGFSGYLLPWNTISLFATKVGTDIAGSLPLIGEKVLLILRGGPDISGATLTRFFGIHVAILPVLTIIILGLHLYLVQIHGMSIPQSILEKNKKIKAIPFFPHFLYRDLLGWLIIIAILGALGALFPWELGEKADLFASAPAGIKPEWYFWFMFETLKFMPEHFFFLDGDVFAVIIFSLGAFFWIFVPFFDIWSLKNKPSPFFKYLGIIIVLYIIIFSLLALR